MTAPNISGTFVVTAITKPTSALGFSKLSVGDTFSIKLILGKLAGHNTYGYKGKFQVTIPKTGRNYLITLNNLLHRLDCFEFTQQ